MEQKNSKIMEEKAMKKSTIALLSGIVGGTLGAIGMRQVEEPKIEEKKEFGNKMHEFYNLLIRWLVLRQQGKTLDKYFKSNGYKTVAIYGMKELGECLFYELKDTDIQVKYAIDKAIKETSMGLKIVTPQENMEEVDIIVVTAVHYFDDIEIELSNYTDIPVVSLEDVIYETDYIQ